MNEGTDEEECMGGRSHGRMFGDPRSNVLVGENLSKSDQVSH